jgi:hypothetical protein
MFLGSQVSLVRGRVLTERGEGLVGVRVSAAGPLAQGFTLTRYVLAQVLGSDLQTIHFSFT